MVCVRKEVLIYTLLRYKMSANTVKPKVHILSDTHAVRLNKFIVTFCSNRYSSHR